MSSGERDLTVSDNLFSSEDDNDTGLSGSTQKLFLLGFIPKAHHNSQLKAIASDLFSYYFVSWNSSKWTEATGEPSRSRLFLSSADALVFFVNEQTLRNTNCLLTLQYAWHSMVPIIMLRPPLTKLVISKRNAEQSEENVKILGDGAILRNSREEPWQLLNDGMFETVDYSLLQTVLHEGYKISTLYDERDHSRSMSRIRRRLSNLFLNVPSSKGGSSNSSSQPHFYLSPSNHSINSLMSRSADEQKRAGKSRSSSSRRKIRHKSDEKKNMNLTLSLSTGNLHRLVKTSHPNKSTQQFNDNDIDSDARENGLTIKQKQILKSPPPPERIPSSLGSAEVDEIFTKNDAKHVITSQTLNDIPIEIMQNSEVFHNNTDNENEEIDADKFPLPPLTPMNSATGNHSFFATSGRGSDKNTSRSRMNQRFNSVNSQASSLDRRMSLSCIEDLSNYQQTQYLVFPLRDSAKKPYLLKFPEDMHEEEVKHNGSVWGSDTSLEEEIKLAGRIISGIHVDYVDDSPIQSPAPYLGDLS